MRVSQRNGREMKLHQSNVPLLPRSFVVWGVAARKFPPFPRAWNAIIIYLRGNLGLKVNGGGPEKHMAGLEKQRELLAIWQTISRRLLSYEWLCQCICHAPGINPY